MESIERFKTVAFCEINDFCQRVLASHWPGIPIFGDIRELTKQSLEEEGIESGAIDMVCGGFPCQPFSVAGKRRGKEDDRYLWPEMLRIIKEVRPRWVLGENVVGIVNVALDTVLSNLEAEGYETTAFIVPACAVGAPHRRDRVWIVANGNGKGLEERKSFRGHNDQKQPATKRSGLSREHRPDDHRRVPQSGLGMHFDGLSSRLAEHGWPAPCGCDQYPWEPPRMTAENIPYRKQKLQALGNAVIPQVVREIGRAILHANKQYGTLTNSPTR